MHGNSQAVRLPKEFRFEGEEVYVERQGKSVVLTPKATAKAKDDDPWREMFEIAKQWDHSVPFERNQPQVQQVRKSFDEAFPLARTRAKSRKK